MAVLICAKCKMVLQKGPFNSLPNKCPCGHDRFMFKSDPVPETDKELERLQELDKKGILIKTLLEA